MATVLGQVIATAPAAVGPGTAVSPFVGALLVVGGAIIDSQWLMPALAGKGRQDALPPRLQGVPVGPNAAGAPRVIAFGGRVRVPTHVLFQKEKVRETQASSNKQGTSVPQRDVLIDCLISLNDRKTVELTQLIGNGKLLMWESRNLVRLTTHEMTAAVSGADVVVTMSNTLSPSPTDVFKVGNFVKLMNWVTTAGANVNGLFWRISAITGHTSIPGTITLQVVNGQTVAGIAANAGNPFSPGHIERIDDALFFDPATFTIQTLPFPAGAVFLDVASRDTAEVFNTSDEVRVWNVTHSGGAPPGSVTWTVAAVDQTRISLYPLSPAGATLQGPAFPANQWPRIEFATVQTSAKAFFATGFVPKDHYHDGSEDQGEDPILVAEKGTGNVPAYRGVAYQAIDDFKVTQFGGQLPYSLEAIIRPDASMTWAQALREVLLRAGIPGTAINTTGVALRPFLGYFIRGFVPTATSIQPLLLAGQILGQERDGTVCLFQIENADVTQIQNGAAFSDLGAHIYGDQRLDDKIATEDGAEEDLPTFVGVRHQDPDNAYADGYQPFGLRNPNGVSHENRQEIDLSTMVLSRKDAKNLATTTVRRSWVNSRVYRWSLTACYLDQLENDIQTVTDDDGNVITARVIQRDIGSNYQVNCTLLREDLTLAVSGSPVQSAAGTPPPIIITPATLVPLVLDITSLSNAENAVPMLRFACCATFGGHWAGGRLFESTDGSNYTAVDMLAEQSTIGQLTEDTPAVAGSSETYGSALVTYFDAPVDVLFDYEGVYGIQPSTPTEAQYVQRNWCAIIDAVTGEVEIAAFTQVTLVAARTYTLNGWLRGLRGTRTAVRPAGSRLVMLGPSWECPTLTRAYPGLSQTTALSFKFVPVGATIEEVAPVQVVSTWRNCRPLPVRKLVKTIGPSPFSARFEFEHWTKEHLPVGAVGPYAMDEPFEGYKISIYDPSGNGVRRIKWLMATPASGTPTLRDKWVDYTPAEQTADGYTPGAATTFVVDVQQVGFLGQISGLSDSNKRTV